jgi:uncharacterized protein (TIGR00369 family)
MDEEEQNGVAALGRRGRHVPLDAAARTEWQQRFNRAPAMQGFGVRIDLADSRIIRVVLDTIEDRHRGGLGTAAINGAVLAALFDCALGVAGTLQFPGRRSATCELSIKFMRPVVGPTVTAYAVTLKKASQLAFADSELYSNGRLCAIASGIVSVASSSFEIDGMAGSAEKFAPPGL